MNIAMTEVFCRDCGAKTNLTTRIISGDECVICAQCNAERDAVPDGVRGVGTDSWYAGTLPEIQPGNGHFTGGLPAWHGGDVTDE